MTKMSLYAVQLLPLKNRQGSAVKVSTVLRDTKKAYVDQGERFAILLPYVWSPGVG